ncbi:glycosyltransferase family 2 protein [Spongiactinospora sp. TRM90649]|uniref:glycosyltransferase family 2 protein n=1 Tax=Spongiactinospora sp. TRM90649 TaxID=3031114 RepID=UPI0023F84764|nr:glycosyltransferase family 2 protein [Spongiactinospora sp. TRM90649]MDF5751161.1 glycosyltransferase family 2 protein [Spongiactinospora sp. TRM90649]
MSSAIGTPVPAVVTAIVVAHDGARWLDDTLAAVLRQSRPADRLVGVDNGSRDGGADLLTRYLGEGNVLSLPRSTGFGDAVEEVLERLPATRPEQEWIWLLHDDCAPDARALEALLWAAEQDPGAVVLGPKLRDWLDRRMLLEVGVTVDRTGRRDTGLEAREYDQGQHEEVREVLAVSTAGMLIRRDVWEDLGGLDPDLPLFRDDLDLCWRARNAGYRVLNVSHAVAWHAEASARRRRRITVGDHHPRRMDRRNALFVVMANVPFRALLWILPRNVLGSIFRTLLLVLAKQPGSALDEITALGSVLRRPFRLLRARRARAYGRGKNYAQIKKLLTPPGAVVRRFTDMIQGYLSGAGPMESAGRHHAASAGRGAEEGDELLIGDIGPMQRIFGNPGVLLFLALLAVTVAAEWRLAGGGRLGGGALAPVAGGAADLWRLYIESFHAGGLGSDTWTPPYVAVLAALSTLTLGQTWPAVTVLLLGCVPLAGVSAYLSTRRMIPRAGARVWLAAAYALLPVATGTVAAGRLGTAVVFVLLPVYAHLVAVVLAGRGRGARRAAWGLGLLLAVGAAFVPLVYVMIAMPLGVVAFLIGRRGVMLSAGVALAVPVALLLPWWGRLLSRPGRILLEAGPHLPSLVDPALPAASLFTLAPGGPGMPPLWTVAGLLAVALAAPLMRRRRIAVAAAWGTALFGLLVAILVSRVTVTSQGGGEQAPAWPGVPLAFAALGLLVAAALIADRLADLRAAGGLRRFAALLTAAVALSTPLIAAAHWVTEGVTGPLRGDAPDVLPALAASGSRGGERTLLLRGTATAGLTYTVLRGRVPLAGESDLPAPDAARTRLALAAAGLVSGRGGADAAVLATYGVRFVALRAPAGGVVDPEVSRALDSQPALVRLSLSETTGVWRTAAPTGLAWIADQAGARTPVKIATAPGGALTAAVPAGGPGRTLVLAEPAGGGWHATARTGDTGELSPATVDGWAQGFRLGQGAATARITHEDPWRRGWLWTQAALVAVVLVLASPGRRSEEPPPDYGETPAAGGRSRRGRRKEMAAR